MSVMKDRLLRGFDVCFERFFLKKKKLIFFHCFQTPDENDSNQPKFEQFKRCFRERAKNETIVSVF